MLTHNQTLYRVFSVLRVLLILFILAYPFYEVVQTKKEYNVDNRSALFGVWQVDQEDPAPAQPDSLATPQPDSLALAPFEDAEAWGRQWEKIFFDIANFGAVKGPGGLAYFSYEVDSLRRQVSLTFFSDSTLNFTGGYAHPSEDRLIINGIHEQDSVQLNLGLLPEFFRERR